MQILILTQTVPADALADERDVEVQAQAVFDALNARGHQVWMDTCDLDLNRLHRSLQERRPQVVFCLVESLGGQESLAYLPAGLLEALHIPFTGSGVRALLKANDKPWTKQCLLEAGLATPPWIVADGKGVQGPLGGDTTRRWILKSPVEHGSLGLSDDSVIEGSAAQAEILIRQRGLAQGKRLFGEGFIEGREVNVGLLASAAGPRVLPMAEILFEGYPEDKPRIIGWQAKWDPESFESQSTHRRFLDDRQEGELVAELTRMARKAWEIGELRGYARVDFRLDSQGQPWILEVNANPCLSPDAGFAAALERAGISFGEACEAILEDALRGPS